MHARFSLLPALTLAVAGLAALRPAGAQAPGEDPVPPDTRMSVQMQPLAGPPGSSAPVLANNQPDWMRARIARYEAKAFSANRGDVKTERDVVNSVNTDGLKTTCVQSVGTAVVPKGTTLQGNEQVVVLRGDLVNICR